MKEKKKILKQTGVWIEEIRNPESFQNSRDNRIHMPIERILMQGLVIIAMMVSVFGNIQNLFHININASIVYMGIGAETFLCIVLVYYLQGKKKIYLGLIMIYLLILALIWKKIIKFCLVCGNIFCKKWNGSVVAEGYHYANVNQAPNDMAWMYLIFCFWIVWLFVRLIISHKGKLGVLLILLLPLELGLFIGELPQGSGVWVLILSGGIYFAMSRGESSLAVVLQAGGILLCAIILAVSLQPRVEAMKLRKSKSYYAVRDFLQITVGEKIDLAISNVNSRSNFAAAGVAKNNLRVLSSNNPVGRRDLTVVVDSAPTDTVYLKGFAADSYTDTGWEEMSNTDYQTKMERILNNYDSRRFFDKGFDLSQDYMQSHDQGMFQYHNATITLLSANKDYQYVPYYSQVANKDNLVRDSYLKGTKDRQFSFSFYDPFVTQKLAESVMGLQWQYSINGSSSVVPSGTGTTERNREYAAYEEFVYENELAYPSSLNKLEAASKEMAGDNINVVTMSIDRFLSDTKYDRQPGQVPDDQDFAEYFVFQNKKGFCVHYATVATLLYRMKGYPARYVVGYAVPKTEFVAQSDGTFKADVRDSMAHAWTEVYDYNTGLFGVKEHTPGYGTQYEANGLGDETSEASNTKNEATTEKAKDTSSASTTEKASVQDNTEKNNAHNITPEQQKAQVLKIRLHRTFVGIVVIVFTMICFLVYLVVVRVFMQRKHKKAQSMPSDAAIKYCYKNIYRTCVFLGMPPGDCINQDLYSRMSARYSGEEGFIKQEDWEFLYRTVIQIMFSSEIQSQEEKERAIDIYTGFSNRVFHRLSKKRRFIFRYLKWMW